MSTAHRLHTAAPTAAERDHFARLLKALPFAPLTPPEKLPTESMAQYLARVFDLTAVHRAYAEGHKVDEAGHALSQLATDARKELHQQRRAIHLAAARSIADGKAPKVDAKACAELAAAGNRAEYLKHATMNAMGSVIKIVMAKAQGQAEGGAVSALVKGRLGG